MHSDGPIAADTSPPSAQPRLPHRGGPVADDIRPKSARDRSDRAIERWSRSQHHVLTLAQLEEIGLSARAVRHRVASGRLHRLHRGVFAIGTPTADGLRLAAVLACGEAAVLSHRSAAALWGLSTHAEGPVDVTAEARTGRSRPGLRVHRGELLAADETTTRNGIRCTTVPRTLLDLAAAVDQRTLERAVDRAETLRLFHLPAVQKLLKRHHGRRGSRALAEILAAYSEPTVTRSAAEERFLALIRSKGVCRPRVNASIAVPDGPVYTADFLWPEEQLIVEVDGRAYHDRRAAFEQDRRRDRALALAGFETRRYAASELIERPERVMAEVAAFLSGRFPAAIRPQPTRNRHAA